MRRIAPILLVTGMILMIAPAAFGGGTAKNAKDLFTNVGYSGNDGNRNWSGNWKEEGENDGPGSGLIRSLSHAACPEGSNCLLIKGGGLLSSVAANRFVDTSDLVDTEFSYRIRRYDNSLLSLDPPTLHVEVTDDGQNWDQVASYNLNTNDGSYINQSHGVEHLASTTFGVRFRVSDILPATEDVGVYIDFVEVMGVVPASTTTTTTTTTTSSTTTSLPITTTLPTITTTTLPGLLTTSTSTTTTTSGVSSTTTTNGGSSTTSTSAGTSSDGQSGSSGNGSTTTTSEVAIASPSPDDPEPNSTLAADPVLREASIGIQAAFDGGRFGDLDGTTLEVMGVAIEPNYSMAVEVIESSWAYLLVLILLIATVIVSGLDRRRLKRAKHTNV